MRNQKIKTRIGLLTIMLIGQSIFAKETGTVISKIEGWTAILKTSLNAGVAAFAIVGGFIIFIQYMQGNESAQKNFIRFVIGLAIFGLVGLIANVFLKEG